MPKTGVKTGHGAKKNATSFSKDNPRPGPGRGKKKPMQEVGQRLVEELERGYSTAQQPDEPPGVTSARRLAHEDYPKFLAMWLKAKELAGAGEQTPVVMAEEVLTAAAGEREEKVEELAKRLLDEWEVEDAGSHPVGRGEETE